MKTREDYDAAILIVGSIVRSWDPYHLLASGSPSDEFDAEIAAIVTHIPRITSSSTAAAALSSVMSAAFEPELFSPSQCLNQGQELFTKLSAARLVPKD